MGFDGKGLDINGQGMTNPIQAEERPCYAGFRYVNGKWEVKKWSKTDGSMEASRIELKPLVLQK